MTTTTLARLYNTGNLSLKGIKVITWDTYDDTSIIDDTTILDDTYNLDDTAELSTFFNYIFGTSSGSTAPDKILLDNRGYLFCAGITESAEITNIIQVNSDNTIDLKGIITENVSF